MDADRLQPHERGGLDEHAVWLDWRVVEDLPGSDVEVGRVADVVRKTWVRDRRVRRARREVRRG